MEHELKVVISTLVNVFIKPFILSYRKHPTLYCLFEVSPSSYGTNVLRMHFVCAGAASVPYKKSLKRVSKTFLATIPGIILDGIF